VGDAARGLAVRRLIAALLVTAPALVRAHDVEVADGMEPWVTGCLVVAAFLYIVGLRNLWRRAGVGRGVGWGQVAMYGTGWLTLVGSLSGPIEHWSGASFAAHMLQHELMMVVAAPALAASAPLGVFAWALPMSLRRSLHALTKPAWLRASWRVVTSPLWATAISIGVLWLWHVPRLFDLAIAHRGWHASQHASFFVSALAFWWAVRATRSGVGRLGPTILALFVAMIVTGALGGLLAFADTAWYAAYAATSPPFGWTHVEDQQMGGLIMWIPGGTIYMAVALLRMRDALKGTAVAPIVHPAHT
jgi:putative membrane protein